MEMQKIVKAHGKEVALGVVVLAAAGTTLGLILRKHAHRFEVYEQAKSNPDVLNSSKLPEDKRLRVNRIAAFILTNDGVDRKALREGLGYNYFDTREAISYLSHHGMIRHIPKQTGVNAHYEPTQGLLMAAYSAALNETRYPELAAAAEILRQNQEG